MLGLDDKIQEILMFKVQWNGEKKIAQQVLAARCNEEISVVKRLWWKKIFHCFQRRSNFDNFREKSISIFLLVVKSPMEETNSRL